MPRIRARKGVQKYINTVQGRAYYLYTEVENKYGKWNDNHWTRNGEYVIHRGKRHHVYSIHAKPKPKRRKK